MFKDAHNHLHFSTLAPYRDAIMQRMKDANITQCVVNGTHPDDWHAVLALHHQFPDVIIPALGLHPWQVHRRPTDWLEQLLTLLDQYPQAVIGETGLDRWIKSPDLPAQIDCFKAHLAIAHTRNLPISIHCLKAWGSLVEILQTTPLPRRGVHIHGFGGSAEVMQQLASLNPYYSLCGYFLKPEKEHVFRLFKNVPSDRLLIESDAPDMIPPQEYILDPIENINSPLNMLSVVEPLARLRQSNANEITSLTSSNFDRYFSTTR